MRGDLYRLKAPRDAHGHEQAGARYAVVVQSDDLPLSTWLIAPTSTGRRAAIQPAQRSPRTADGCHPGPDHGRHSMRGARVTVRR